jgi:ribosomal protein S18 acetylase RimI-like enzyme
VTTQAEAGGGPGTKRRAVAVGVREMTIDDLSDVYELGEGVFGDRRSPNIFRFWEPAEVLDLFETDSEFCLVAEAGDELVGAAPRPALPPMQVAGGRSDGRTEGWRRRILPGHDD